MKATIPSTSKLLFMLVLIDFICIVICKENNNERTEACDILIAYGK